MNDGFKTVGHSLQQQTNLSHSLAQGSRQSTAKATFAAERARLLLGQFRRGEANDPATFITSVAAVLARYPDEVIAQVTDPRTGLATKGDWLPTIHEIVQACEGAVSATEARSKSEKAIEETLARRRESVDRNTRPSVDQLRDKYGKNWGIQAEEERISASKREYLARRDRERAERAILAEYGRLGRTPVYAGDMLVSPGLAAMLDPHRSEAE